MSDVVRPVAWHGCTPGGHVFTTFSDEDGADKGRVMGLSIVPVFADPNPELERLRAELAAAKERAEKAEGKSWAQFANEQAARALAAEAKAEGLAKALEGAKNDLLDLAGDQHLAPAVERIDRALAAYRTDKEQTDGQG